VIEVYDDSFDEVSLWRVFKHFESYDHWDYLPDVVGQPGTKGKVFDDVFEPIAYTMIQQLDTTDFRRCLYNAFTYEDCPKPHIDSRTSRGLTYMIYINPNWDAGMGGETVFLEDREIVKSVAPRFGRLVKFRSDIWHSARPPMKDAGTRYSLVFQTHPIGEPSMADIL